MIIAIMVMTIIARTALNPIFLMPVNLSRNGMADPMMSLIADSQSTPYGSPSQY